MVRTTKSNSNKADAGYKRERQSKDGRKHSTKGGKGGKVQSDGSGHRAMGSLDEEFMKPTTINKHDFDAVRTDEFDYDSDVSSESA